jgi:hypothetical protein
VNALRPDGRTVALTPDRLFRKSILVNSKTLRRPTCAIFAVLLLTPGLASACACGCGVFGVGADTLMSDAGGGALYAEYDGLDQSRNWSGASRADAALNEDKKIRTDFYTLGARWQVKRDLALSVEVPVWSRAFTTETDSGVQTFRHTALADVRLLATWTGLFHDRSLGLIGGIKLATGDHGYANFDPDTEISSGSTDLVAGAYKRGLLDRDGAFTWFAQGVWQKPLDWRAGFRPGEEINLGLGVAWRGWSLADGKVQISPVAQLKGSIRARDHGENAMPDNSGYERLVLAPGVEISSGRWSLYGDLGFPVLERVNGNQLVSPLLVKARLTRRF